MDIAVALTRAIVTITADGLVRGQLLQPTLLIPQVSEVARLGDRVAEVMIEEEVSLEDILYVLDEERENYYREHYVRP